MRAIVQFSGGAASYVAGRLAQDKYGPENTTWLFADTKEEDEDLYRFMEDVEQKIGQSIVRIAEGRTPWEVFFDEGMIGNTRADPCSRILKRELLTKWHEENADPDTDVVIIGFDANEIHRLEGPRLRNAPFEVEYPLVDHGIFKEQVLRIVEQDGLKLSRMYEMGFPHDNCGGQCIKAGQAVWRLLLINMPERYAKNEAREERFRQKTGKDVAILRDRRGGTTKPLTLKALRERHESEPETIDLFDYGACHCMEPAL